MATPFINIQEPSPAINKYSWDQERSEQDAAVPAAFLDAIEVRTKVFIDYQKVPRQNEFDGEDARSCHFVAYASINEKSKSPRIHDQVFEPGTSTTVTLPIATIRIVPFPHDPHPEPGSHHSNDDSSKYTYPPPYINDRKTDFHDGKEPYVKLGRIAVIREFSGMKLGSRMVQEAMSWLRQNPTYFNPSITEMGIENMAATTTDEIPVWQGLVCVHAQTEVVHFWERLGFVIDKKMGDWVEEGIAHLGMWKRLDLTRDDAGKRGRHASTVPEVAMISDNTRKIAGQNPYADVSNPAALYVDASIDPSRSNF